MISTIARESDAATPATDKVQVSPKTSFPARQPEAEQTWAELLNLAAGIKAAQYPTAEQRDFARPHIGQAQRHQALAWKRLFDVPASVLLLLAAVPLMTISALLIWLTSSGPILFGHRRVGLNGREFHVWKFRTMYEHSDEILKRHLENDSNARAEWQALQKLTRDPRVTPIGQMLRRFSLDELPQLWNVVIGEMSLVGPRPIVKEEVRRYGDAIQHYYSVRPGLTGLWQVSGRSKMSYHERVCLDRQYIQHWSAAKDAAILLKTFVVLLTGEGAF